MKFLIDKFLSHFKNTDRTKNIKANIKGIILIKGLSIILSLLVVPLTINYISPYQYGVWITISTLIAWLSFFDIGFGNGLKNKLVVAITNKDFKLARIYISTTYAILIIIVSLIWTITLFSIGFIDWNTFLNVEGVSSEDLLNVLSIVLTTFAFQFVLGLLNTILTSLQQPVVTSIINTTSQLILLISIYVLTKTTNGSLIYLSLVMGITNTSVLFLFSFYFFRTSLKKYSPKLSFVNFNHAKDLFKIGISFFVLQIIAIVLYETNNIIITKNLGPLDVTVYNLAFKYVSILGLLFTLILSPFWTAFIEARVLNDVLWMKQVKKKLYIAFYWFIPLGVFIVLVSPFAYVIWFGKTVEVPYLLTVLMAFWQILNMWNSLHSTLIYGYGKIRIQLYGSIFIGILNIPLTILFCKSLGLNGVIISQIILTLLIAWIGPIQLNKLLNSNANGIWNK